MRTPRRHIALLLTGLFLLSLLASCSDKGVRMPPSPYLLNPQFHRLRQLLP